MVGKFTECSETFTWQWSSSKFSNFLVCRKNSTHSFRSKCSVWLPVQRMSRSLFSRLIFAFVVDSVHAFKLKFSVSKARSPASSIRMVNLNCDWFFKLVKILLWNVHATFAILQCEQAIFQDVGLTTKLLSLLHHLSRSTDFLRIFNAGLLKKSSMPVFSSQEIFYWIIFARQTYCLCCLSDKVSITVYLLWHETVINWVIWEKFRSIIVMWCDVPNQFWSQALKPAILLRDGVLKRTHSSWGFQPTWAHIFHPHHFAELGIAVMNMPLHL